MVCELAIAFLGVAGGSGNAALAAARRGCAVTGPDYVSELLVRASERGVVEGLVVGQDALGDPRDRCYR